MSPRGETECVRLVRLPLKKELSCACLPDTHNLGKKPEFTWVYLFTHLVMKHSRASIVSHHAGGTAHCGSRRWGSGLSVLVIQEICFPKFAFSQISSFLKFDMFCFLFSISGKESIIAGPFSWPAVHV